jgi:hypothetical protein
VLKGFERQGMLTNVCGWESMARENDVMLPLD